MILSARTRELVRKFTHNPPQAVLLTGEEGVGLRTLAEYMASQAGQLLEYIEPVSKSANSQRTIPVEAIRELYDRAKTRYGSPHFIIIDDADRMNMTAQNALLKLLEEPNQSIHFILTSHNSDSLLATIRSRLQQEVVPRIDTAATQRLLRQLEVKDEVRTRQLLFVANGLPAAIHRLVHQEDQFNELVAQVQLAKRYIEGRAYDKLIVIQELKDNRERAISFLSRLIQLLKSSPSLHQDTLQRIDLYMEAREAIRQNGNVRLQLLSTVV